MIDDKFRKSVAIRCATADDVTKVKDFLKSVGERVYRDKRLARQLHYNYVKFSDNMQWAGAATIDREIVISAEEVLKCQEL